MSGNKLVSIITPCYNGENCLARMLDSVIAQTYRPIEYILVNDGSTDGTLALAESYIPKFREAGIDFKIINQENKGLAGAINAGLRCFTGDYLCWPDADDYLEPTSVEDRVKVLEENPEYAVVSSDAYIRNCDDLKSFKLLSSGLKYTNDPNQFEHHLNGDSIFCSGCHMVRSSMFLAVYPDRLIYPAHRGQNWQMLLPVYYKYKWIFLDKPLYNVIVYPTSMSKNKNTLEAVLFRYNEHEEIITHTLKKIEDVQNVDLHMYHSFVLDKYAKLRMDAALKYGNKSLFEEEYVKKQQNTGLDKKDRLAYLRNRFSLINVFMKLSAKLLRTVVPPNPEEAIKKIVEFKNKTQYQDYREIKVSILIPCYNASNYLDMCFKSLMRQSHRNIQILIMDDGSIDDSSSIIETAKKSFSEVGIEFMNFSQSNQGAAAAVNSLLPYANGKYILLYDTDDVLYRESIFEQVHFLETHNDFDMVRTNGYYVSDLTKTGKELFVNKKSEMRSTDIFSDLVRGKTYNWPGSYMIRRDEFFKRTGGNIYISRFGQNLQFMLPMAYHSKTGFINKPLMSYYIHLGSHSHSGGVEWTLQRIHGYANNRVKILESMNMDEQEREQEIALIQYDEKNAVYKTKQKQANLLLYRIYRYLERLVNKVKRVILSEKNERYYRQINEHGYWSYY